MRQLTKKQPLKVHVKVIKKGLPVDTLTSLLFSTMEAGTKDKGKGKFSGLIVVHLIVAWWF